MPNLLRIIGIIIGIIMVFLYIWFFIQIRKQYKKFEDSVYVKRTLSDKEWVGKPITSKLIKKVSTITCVIAIILFLASNYILINLGANNAWALLTAMELILIYATILWINYNQRQSKVKVNKSNIKFTRIYSKIFFIIFIGIAFLASIFKDIVMSTPYFQMGIIGLALFIIIVNEVHYRKIIS